MDASKSVLLSKTYWGLAATVVGTIFSGLGINITPDDLGLFGQHVGAVINDVLTYGGIILAFYGRWKAVKPLHVTAPSIAGDVGSPTPPGTES